MAWISNAHRSHISGSKRVRASEWLKKIVEKRIKKEQELLKKFRALEAAGQNGA